MKNLTIDTSIRIRRRDKSVISMYGGTGDSECGVFDVKAPTGAIVLCIASSGEGWDHVSASLANRTPTWEEMEFVKRQFFKRSETVVQIHPPEDKYVNLCATCLHLWRPHNETLPLPPRKLIA